MSDWNRVIILRRLRGPALLLLTGVIALLDQMNILTWDHAWPLYLILLGVLALAERAAMATLAAAPYTGNSGYPNGGYPGYPSPGYPSPGYPNPGQPNAYQTSYGQTGPASSATQPSQPAPEPGSIVPVSPWTALAAPESPAAPTSRWSQDGEREGEEPHQ